MVCRPAVLVYTFWFLAPVQLAHATPVRPPSPPEPLSVRAVSPNIVQLSWGRSLGATAFNVYASANNGASWRLLVTLRPTTTSYVVCGLAAGSNLIFVVQATGPGGAALSRPVAVRTPGPPPLPPNVNTWAGSPNGLPVGQCTWWCDGRANETGWRLHFSQGWGRDARLWVNLVTNAHTLPFPVPGSIMVLAGWNGNTYGHVAFVESVQGNRWTVTHANFPAGTVVRNVQGAPIRQVQFEYLPGNPGMVRVVGGSHAYPLSGFLVR